MTPTRDFDRPPLPVAADVLPEHFIGWANQMAARFGRPVYLVGSALHEPRPRDYDVRVVLSNQEFTDRYGIELDVYETSLWLPLRFPQLMTYFNDMAKMARSAAGASHLNTDFQVQPLREAYRHKDRRRMRLDLVEGLEDVLDVALRTMKVMP